MRNKQWTNCLANDGVFCKPSLVYLAIAATWLHYWPGAVSICCLLHSMLTLTHLISGERCPYLSNTYLPLIWPAFVHGVSWWYGHVVSHGRWPTCLWYNLIQYPLLREMSKLLPSLSLCVLVAVFLPLHASPAIILYKWINGLWRCRCRSVVVKLKATPPPPRASDDWSSLVDEEEEEEDDGRSVSHYIPCTGRDRDYCLHGGECRVFPDGRYKHCRYVCRTFSRSSGRSSLHSSSWFILPLIWISTVHMLAHCTCLFESPICNAINRGGEKISKTQL